MLLCEWRLLYHRQNEEIQVCQYYGFYSYLCIIKYNKNRKGLKIDPCGGPKFMEGKAEKEEI